MLMQAARSFVLRTARFPVLDSAYEEYYRRTAESLDNIFASVNDEIAILLHLDKQDHHFSPGLSDVDFSLIIPAVDIREKLGILERFWSSYYRAKRSCPILGEVVIFDVDELAEFVRLGGGRASNRKVLRVVHNSLRPADAERVTALCARRLKGRPEEIYFFQDLFSRYLRSSRTAWKLSTPRGKVSG